MRLRAAVGPFLLIVATAACAAGLLPLKNGIYVRAGTPCKGASNADTLSYWGADNGINDQQTSCKINDFSRDGATYLIKRTCTSGRFGGSFNDEVTVTVLDTTSFVIRHRAALGARSDTFRYCGSRVQF
jgi:hypothetical protein